METSTGRVTNRIPGKNANRLRKGSGQRKKKEDRSIRLTAHNNRRILVSSRVLLEVGIDLIAGIR